MKPQIYLVIEVVEYEGETVLAAFGDYDKASEYADKMTAREDRTEDTRYSVRAFDIR